MSKMFSLRQLLVFAIFISVFSSSLVFAESPVASETPALSSIFNAKLNPELFSPPQEENPSLSKSIDMSFHESKLSDVLNLLSKIGNFNLVLPEAYDRIISINLHEKTIRTALEDICRISNLSYKFEKNTLTISSYADSQVAFSAIPILYADSNEISESINNGLFKQLILAQADSATKPYSFVSPNKNSVIVAGNEEQLKVAKNFIQELDKAPFVKIYAPSFISLDDAIKIIRTKLSHAKLEVTRSEESFLVISGNELEVLSALEILRAHDKYRAPIQFYVEVFALNDPSTDKSFTKNFIEVFGENKLQRINSEYASSVEFLSFAERLDKKFFEEFSLAKNQEKDIHGLRLQAEPSVLEDSLYELYFLDQMLNAVSNNDIATYLSKVGNLPIDDVKSFRIESSLSEADYVLILIKEVSRKSDVIAQ